MNDNDARRYVSLPPSIVPDRDSHRASRIELLKSLRPDASDVIDLLSIAIFVGAIAVCAAFACGA